MVDSTRVAFFLGAEVKVMGEAPMINKPTVVAPSLTIGHLLPFLNSLHRKKKTKQGPYHLQMDLWSL